MKRGREKSEDSDQIELRNLCFEALPPGVLRTLRTGHAGPKSNRKNSAVFFVSLARSHSPNRLGAERSFARFYFSYLCHYHLHHRHQESVSQLVSSFSLFSSLLVCSNVLIIFSFCFLENKFSLSCISFAAQFSIHNFQLAIIAVAAAVKCHQMVDLSFIHSLTHSWVSLSNICLLLFFAPFAFFLPDSELVVFCCCCC